GFSRDWSSDVCSSDLDDGQMHPAPLGVAAGGLLGEAGAGHAVADDHDAARPVQGVGGLRRHREPPVGPVLRAGCGAASGAGGGAGSMRTAATLNSGIRLTGSRAGLVRSLAVWAPP